MLEEAVERMHQRNAAKTILPHCPVGRICWDHIVETRRLKRKPPGYYLALSGVSGATWTGKRLMDARYQLNAEILFCPLCGDAVDTMAH